MELMRRLLPLLLLVGCGSETELVLVNRLDRTVGVELRAPDPLLVVDSNLPFRERLCAGQYASLGVVDFPPNSRRPIELSDEVSDTQCSNMFWLRMLWLGPAGEPDGEQTGPIEDAGTLVQLPTTIEVEEGAGAIHQAAFPELTARFDAPGGVDALQDLPPAPCP